MAHLFGAVKTRARAAIAAGLCVALALAPARAQDAPAIDYAGFVNRAMDAMIVPAFVDLDAAAQGLDASVSAYCGAPSDDLFAPVDAAFRQTVIAWGHVKALPVAPLDTDNRRDRFFFWPDPRGTTLRQIQPVIIDHDESVIDPVQLHDKSVALQGLGALEFVLYGAGAESILAGDEDGRFRCRYATAITAGFVNMAGALVAETAPGSDFDTLIRNPGPDNPIYPSADAAMADLIIAASTEVELARDSLLLPVLGDSPEFARPHIAPLWRSGLSMTFLKALTDGAQQLLAGGDLMQVLPADTAWIQDSLDWEFWSISDALPADDQSIDLAAVDGDYRQTLFRLVAYTDNLRSLIAVSIPKALDLSGFNFADGD
jgi:predicted lipoprotein